MITSVIRTIHKQWVLRVAFDGMPYTWRWMVTAGTMHSYYWMQGFYWTMKNFYPVFFLIMFFYAATVLLSLDSIVDVFHLFEISLLLSWSLFYYLAMKFWLWYRNECLTMKTPKEKRLIRFVMKKMLTLSFCYVATHAFFFFLFNCWILAGVVLSVVLFDGDLLLVAMLPFIDVGFIIMLHGFYYYWIRMATYPLRYKLFRQTA